MKKPAKPTKLRDKPKPPKEPEVTEVVDFYRAPSALEELDCDYANMSEEERKQLAIDEYGRDDEEGVVYDFFGDKYLASDLDFSSPRCPDEIYYPSDTSCDHCSVPLNNILEQLPEGVDELSVDLHADNWAGYGTSDSYLSIRASYTRKTPDYDKKMKKYKKEYAKYEEDLKRWKEDKKKKTAEIKKYRADMKKYKEWREKKIAELEAKGEL